MGLFSKKKTYVESSTVPIHAEIRDTVTQSVLSSILQDRPIGDDLIANTLGGLGAKAKTYYRYGRDKYHYGLPEGTQEIKRANSSTMKLVIESIEGEPVTIEFNIFSSADSLLFADEYLNLSKEVESSDWVSSTQVEVFYTDDTTETYTVPTAIVADRYYHVKYLTATETKYFYYNANDPTYEVLEVIDTVKESAYYPVVPFIRNNVDLTQVGSGNALYDTSKKLLKKIGLNYQDIADSIQENPDIDGVDQAYLIIAAPVQSESVPTQEYLFNYFFYLAQTQTVNKQEFENWLSGTTLLPPPTNVITIREDENNAAGKGNYHIELGFSYIETAIKVGTIGKKGHVERETVINASISFGFLDSFEYETSYMIWRKQTSPGIYTELKVVGLKQVNYIYGNRTIDTTLKDSLSEDNDDFNIPINSNILHDMTLLRQTDVMNDSIRLCFNSIETIKLKWYQTGIFKVLIIIVAAVLTVLAAGSDGGTFMAAAIAITGTVAATTLNFVIAVLIAALSNLAIGKLINVIGAKKFAILALIYSVYRLSQGDFTVITGELAVALVSNITQLANIYIMYENDSLLGEAEQIKAKQEEQQAELDELIEAYPIRNLLDPMSIVDSSTPLERALESPEQYYDLRIHTGNIGALAFSEIQNYVESNLRLEGITDRKGLDI